MVCHFFWKVATGQAAIVDSKIDSIRQIQGVLEHVIKANKALLIIGQVEAPVLSALVMNKIKGNIKINVIDPPAFGLRRKEILEDLSLLTSAQIINEDLGDDLNTIQIDYLGECLKATTSNDQKDKRYNLPVGSHQHHQHHHPPSRP